MALIIAADEIKKELPNYTPDKAEEFHLESAKKADKLFDQALKDESYQEVVLLSGGTASGKTEFLVTQLKDTDCIIMDATLATELGAKNKISKIIKCGKKPIIYSVIPDDLQRAFVAFLNRDRKFSDMHFYKTHSGSSKTLLWIAQNYPDVIIHIIESSYDITHKIQFDEIKLSSNKEVIDYLTRLQMTEDDIITAVSILKK